MNALESFGLSRGDVVALVGGGGKTALRDCLADEAHAAGWTVVATTTTKSGPIEGPCVVEADPVRRTAEVQMRLKRDRRVFVFSSRAERRWIGVEPEWLDTVHADLIVVEADGARKKPLKAPAAHEPVIPASATVVIAVVGAEVIGAPLDDSGVHRWPLFFEATGLKVGEPAALASFIESPAGYRKSVTVRFVPFINKASRARPGMIESLTAALQSPRVVWGDARDGRFNVRTVPAGA